MAKKNMQSNMTHNFADVETRKWPRSRFFDKQNYKTMIDSGKIYPVFVEECLPGDFWQVVIRAFGRLATPLVPFMDNLYMDFHVFFAQNRNLWDNWRAFTGEREDPGDDPTTYTVPQVTCPAGGWAELSLADYMGLPTKKDNATVNALPFRGHNANHKHYFRDQNIIDGSDYPINNASNGPDTDTDYGIYRRGKRHDYFTSCLPWPQKRATQITLPLSGDAKVLGLAFDAANTWTGTPSSAFKDSAGTQGASLGTNWASLGGSTWMQSQGDEATNTPNVRADLSSVSGTTINDLRENIAFQQAYELDARSGTRYNEWIKAHYGVDHPVEGYKPEFVHFSSSAMYQTPVPNTSEDAANKQGHLSSFASFSQDKDSFEYAVTEHGWLYIYVSIRSDLTYSQGIHKKWTRTTLNDYYRPIYANLGEQAVLNKEIFYNNDANDDLVFGYNERWSEYKYGHSLHTGPLRHNYTGTLNKWHLGQEFGSVPSLDQTFIEETPPVSRVVAVPSEPEVVLDCQFLRNVTRQMPVFNTPGLHRI